MQTLQHHDITFPAKCIKISPPYKAHGGDFVRITIGEEHMMDFLNAIMTDPLVDSFFHAPKVREWFAEQLVGSGMLDKVRLENTGAIDFQI
jgi:hypothetical protein